MRMSIVGLGQSGKTTFFNLLTSRGVEGSLSGKKGASIGTVFIPDPRLDQLTAVFQPKKKVEASLEFMDTPALQTGQAGGGFAAASLEEVRRADTLCLVVREFDSPTAPHPAGKVDGMRDLDNVLAEFIFMDLAVLERRRERLRKTAAVTKKPEEERELEAVEHAMAALEAETPLHRAELSDNDRKALAGYQLLTAKPLLVVLNVGENQMADLDGAIARYRERFPTCNFTALCAAFELELVGLSAAEAAEFMADAGLREPALARILHACFGLLGLHVFFTAGPDECRAWPIPRNATAFDAAGVIHTDFQRGFIRAVVLPWAKFAEQPHVNTHKLMSTQERRDYLMQDGDIVEFRFSVSK